LDNQLVFSWVPRHDWPMNEGERAQVLASFAAQPDEIAELLRYNANDFRHDLVTYPVGLPLVSEAHVAVWETYAAEARQRGPFPVLADALTQLHFPIREGLSQTDEYRDATLRGCAVAGLSSATGLPLVDPDRLELRIHHGLAGSVPVLIARNRADFRQLVQALTARNEPVTVPDSMGACIVAGYNNWDRIRRIRRQWERTQPGSSGELEWRDEFRRLIPQKERYQDRFIILSNSPYSGVPGETFGFGEEEWAALSLTIRLEHECAHYLTRRLLSRMKNNTLDELIADYCGIVAAAGEYRGDWALEFLGLSRLPDCGTSGRLYNYRGEPPLSDGAFRVLQALVTSAVSNIEQFHARHVPKPAPPKLSTRLALAITRLTIEELACPDAQEILERTWERTEKDYVFVEKKSRGASTSGHEPA